jgi:TetR/AcrR family transcriptional regulator, transcriptional repressor for nem operon
MGKGEITRQRIIELAAPLFNQRGFAGCSMDDILKATGLKKGGVYRHFKSKEELAAESLRFSLSTATKIRTPQMSPSKSAAERLREMIKQFMEEPSPLAGGCPILNTAIDADDGNPVLRKLALEGLTKWKSRISRIVQEGISRKQIRRDVNPRSLANTIVATLEGALMISRLEGSRTALHDSRVWLEELIDRSAEPAP